MKISELIKKLEEIKEIKGDLDVWIGENEEDMAYEDIWLKVKGGVLLL